MRDICSDVDIGHWGTLLGTATGIRRWHRLYATQSQNLKPASMHGSLLLQDDVRIAYLNR